MAKAALIFNPNAGRGGESRMAALECAANVLRAEGIDAEVIATIGSGTAGAQATDAANRGAGLIFACGGDGTLHDVIQGLAQKLTVSVGIIPFGSANALARHFGLSFDPAQAIRQQLNFAPRTIPLGRVTCSTSGGPRARWFAVMAGAGPDGMLVYRMLAAGKHRLGRSMYYIRAAKIFLGTRFPAFQLQATLHDGSSARARSCQRNGYSRRRSRRTVQSADSRGFASGRNTAAYAHATAAPPHASCVVRYQLDAHTPLESLDAALTRHRVYLLSSSATRARAGRRRVDWNNTDAR